MDGVSKGLLLSARHCHFETGERRPNDTFLTDEEYGRALDTLVKGCADVLITYGNKILLGRRNVEPAKDAPWFIGGRIKVGDTVSMAARKNMLRETKLDIDEDRFEFVCTSTQVWGRRKQAPCENGTADVIVVSTVEINDEEKGRIEMLNTEYDGYFWKTAEEILAGGEYHMALKVGVRAMNFNAKQNLLVEAIHSNGSDEEIASLARNLYA